MFPLVFAVQKLESVVKYVVSYRWGRESVVKYVGPYRRRRESVVKYVGPYRRRRERVVKHVGPARFCCQDYSSQIPKKFEPWKKVAPAIKVIVWDCVFLALGGQRPFWEL